MTVPELIKAANEKLAQLTSKLAQLTSVILEGSFTPQHAELIRRDICRKIWKENEWRMPHGLCPEFLEKEFTVRPIMDRGKLVGLTAVPMNDYWDRYEKKPEPPKNKIPKRVSKWSI